MAEYAAIPAGSFRNEGYESGAELRAQLEHFGRMVGGRAHRRNHRLVHRRAAAAGVRPDYHGQCQRGAIAIYEAGKYNPADVLQGAVTLFDRHAARHCHQWIVFQYAAYGSAVRHRRVSALKRSRFIFFSSNSISACVPMVMPTNPGPISFSPSPTTIPPHPN